ncbi:adenylosuccinate synthase [Myxococcota bacterium]
MPVVVIVGAQWGDEGKGKITDYLACDADMVVRYQGGNNAGHTIVVGPSTYKFHLVPSGMLHKDKACVLGNGMVVDPEVLIAELDKLEAEGVETGRLKISARAHVILPSHKFLDLQSEERKGASKIGTTGRGIGPAYRDKVNRGGVRMCDPAHPELLRTKIEQHFNEHRAELEGCEWDPSKTVSYLEKAYERLAAHVCDTSTLINERLDQGGRVLLEGAQGTLLDIDHGTYPFVTSSNPTAGGACIGAGIGPTRINVVMGVSKAYATRVGSGPFPTELTGVEGDQMREAGKEYGTTTGRPRRCGWIDLVALRFAVRVNGMTHLAITKLDVLDGLDEIRICTGYRIHGKEVSSFPVHVPDLDEVEPVLETLPGWKTATSNARTWSDLPARANSYISRIEEILRVPVALVSVGADRAATFARLAVWEGL